MEDFIFTYAVLSVAWVELKSVMALNRLDKAHAKSVWMPICMLMILDYITPWVSSMYFSNDGYMLILSVCIVEAVLIAEVLFILNLRFRRLLHRWRSGGEG